MTTIAVTNPLLQQVDAATVVEATILDATKAQQLAGGLLDLAALIESAPAEVVDDIASSVRRLLIPVWTREAVAGYTRLGLRMGARVTKHVGDKYAGVDLSFGPVALHVYIGREEVCERIVVGTREETEEVPDPELLATVPKVTVTRTVEEVEWRCMPLLADELPRQVVAA